MKKVVVILFIIVSVLFPCVASVEKCVRSAKDEGWSWVKTIEEIEDGDVGILLRKVHDTMHQKSTLLQKALPINDLMQLTGQPKKNLLLCRMSLILKPTAQPAAKKVFYSTDVFENCLFISAEVELSALKDSKKWEFDPKKSGEKDPEKPFYTSHTFVKPDQKVYIISFNRQQYPEFYRKHEIALRTCALYKGVPDERASKKARLARKWIALKQKEPASNDSIVIEWHNEASKAAALHTELARENSTDENYFDGDNDSEQKFLYYVNEITDCLNEFNELENIIKSIIQFIECMAPFRAGQIRELMNGEENFSSCEQCVKSLRSKLENLPFNSDSNKETALKSLTSLENALAVDNKKTATNIIEFLKEPPIMNENESFSENILSFNIKIAKKYNQEYETKNFKELKELVDKVKGIAEKILSKTTPSYKELKRYLSELKDSLKLNGFKTDPSITAFKKFAQKAVEENQNHIIDKIVLHLHNTYDCCANCAPDLAQELKAEGRFIDYFTKLAESHNVNKRRPQVMILASCSFERPHKWCDKCKEPFEQRPDGNVFYQYLYPVDHVEITSKGAAIADPANEIE